jgi:hypothetical protein
VPTAIWIDEHGVIVRPNDVAFGSEIFKDLTGFDSTSYLEAVRAWARDGTLPFDRREVKAHQMLPKDEQSARAEFGLAWHLHQAGRSSGGTSGAASRSSCRRTISRSGVDRCRSKASIRWRRQNSSSCIRSGRRAAVRTIGRVPRRARLRSTRRAHRAAP